LGNGAFVRGDDDDGVVGFTILLVVPSPTFPVFDLLGMEDVGMVVGEGPETELDVVFNDFEALVIVVVVDVEFVATIVVAADAFSNKTDDRTVDAIIDDIVEIRFLRFVCICKQDLSKDDIPELLESSLSILHELSSEAILTSNLLEKPVTGTT
jgi:hypothetical protein